MKYSEDELLKDWEFYWGKLEEKWLPTFLNHQSIKSILNYDRKLVQIAISKHSKLISIADYLHQTSFPEVKAQKKSHSKIQVFDRPGSMQQAVNVARKNNKLDPKIPDNDWWREKD